MLRFGLLISLQLLFTASSWASVPEILELDPNVGHYDLGLYLDILEDPSRQLTMGDVSSAPFRDQFVRNNTRAINRGFSRSVFWLRCHLSRKAVGKTVEADHSVFRNTWLLTLGRPAAFFSIKVFEHVLDPTRGDRIIDMTARYRPEYTIFQDAYALVDGVDTPPGTTRTFYLRIVAGSGLFMPLQIATVQVLQEKSKRHLLLLGAFYGLMIAIGLYNFFLFLSLHDLNYLVYVVYVFTLAAYFAGINGLTFHYVDGVSTSTLRRITMGLLAVSLTALIQFCRGLLDTRTHLPQIDRLMLGVIGVFGVFLAILPLAPLSILNRYIETAGLSVPLVAVPPGVMRYIKGFGPARNYTLAWVFSAIGGTSFALTYSGAIPYSDWSYYGYQLGTSVEVLLLSLALAARIKLLEAEKLDLQASERRFLELSMTDALTGLYNRRYFQTELDRNIKQAERSGWPLSLLMLDVDNFKNYNDNYGHPAGDQLLVRIGEILRQQVRDADMPCRYGGEEFAVILTETDQLGAQIVAERIRRAAGEAILRPRQSCAVHMSVSIGAAQHSKGEPGVSFCERADVALYEAKRAGKNRVVLAVQAIASVHPIIE